MKEHVHDWKFKGANPKLSMLGGHRVRGKFYSCACGSVKVVGSSSGKRVA